MPRCARPLVHAKIDAIGRLGADVRRCASYDEAERQAKAFARDGGGRYVSPYWHPDVIAGADEARTTKFKARSFGHSLATTASSERPVS